MISSSPGANVKAVQAQLGHASATVTLDRYGHLYDDDVNQLAERLDRARAAAVTDRARTGTAPMLLPLAKGAAQ